MNSSKRSSLFFHVIILFIFVLILTGVITYAQQHNASDATVKEQTEAFADKVAGEVTLAVKEYPAYEWLLRYWYENAGKLDIEYDAEFKTGTDTERKARLLAERYPDFQPRYAGEQDVKDLPEEGQKLYGEVAYSWLITRVDQIKRTYGIDFLFCVLTDESYETQFFMFSAADEDSVRGTNYEEVYPIGVTVTVSDSQKNAMREASLNSKHLADAGDYLDYYSFVCKSGDHPVLIGLTYNLSGIKSSVEKMTDRSTISAVGYQAVLALVCLTLVLLFVLTPLKKVQHNIRLYIETKNSRLVCENLTEVRPNNEIGQLSEDISDLTREIDRYVDRIRDIASEKQKIESELSVAARIQEAMLPSTFPAFPDRTEFDVYASMDPAREVGGDFYYFLMTDDDHLCVMIADVSGKGVPAALFMMASMILLADNARMGKTPAQILADTNTAIIGNNREEMFVTVWLGILEISTGKLTAANAGHEYPVIKRGSGKYELLKDKHGLVIGAMEGIKYKDYELELKPGDKLFVYTDGVPEATDAEYKLFGTDRLTEALNADPDAEPEQTLKNVREAVDAFVKDAEQFDDLTMLCLEYRGREGEQGNA